MLVSLSTATRQARRVGRTARAGQTSFGVLLAVWQRLHIERGGRVEYPLAASEEPCLWKLRSIDGMRCVRCDQCQFGMTPVDSVENVGPACKATGFMTNDEYIAEAVDRHRFGGHDHIQL